MRLARTVFIVAVLAAIIAPVALALRFTDDSYLTPIGTVGVPYSHTLKAEGGNGPPYTFTLQGGSLPAGLSLNSDGLISGTPTAAGSSTFGVYLTDYSGGCTGCGCVARNNCSWQQFTIKIIEGLAIATPSTPAGTVGTAYNLPLTATGGGTQTWSIAAGALPDGLGLGSNGLISGTPTKAAAFSFTVKVTDGSRTATKGFSITIYAPLAVTPAKLPSAEVGVAFKAPAPAATGGLAPYKWTLNGALPAGLVIDAATGAITGTPTTAGTFAYKLVLTDALGGVKETDQSLTVAKKLTLSPPKKIKLTEVGLDYSLTIGKAGGVEPLKWTATGLPLGLKFDGKTGELAGKPKRGGSYQVTLTATDALGAVSEPLEFEIKVAPKLTITTTRLVGTKVGKQFSRKIVTRGGAGKLSFKITAGKLPVGVRLNRATGTLAGLPNTAGTFKFTVTVTDGLHATSTQTIVLKIVQ